MSKRTGTILIVVVILLLVALLVWGIASGGWSAGFSFRGLPFNKWMGKGNTQLVNGETVTGLEMDADSVRRLRLEFVDEDIEIVAVDSDQIRIVEESNYEIAKEDQMRWAQSGDTLTVQSGKIRRQNWFWNWNTPFQQIVVRVEMPRQMLDSWEVSSTSGTITIEEAQGVDVYVDTMSGDIQLTNVQAQDTLYVASTSGRIQGENVAAQSLDVDTVSGDVTLLATAQEARVSTTSGTTLYEGVAQIFGAGSVSGDIKATLAQPEEIETDTTSGNSKIQCGDASALKSINADSVSGEVDLTLPENGGFNVDFDSISGDVNCDFALANGVYQNGGFEIEANTTSGNLNIRKMG